MSQQQQTSDSVIGAEAARIYGVAPKIISDLFWRGKLDARRCPLVKGRRRIPTDYLPEIGRVLRELGLIPTGDAAV